MKHSDKKYEKAIEKKIEKNVEKWVTKAVTIAVQVIVTFVVTVIVLKFVWGWVIEDVFPGAVEQGLINDDLSWASAMKFAILISIVGGMSTTFKEAFESKNKKK